MPAKAARPTRPAALLVESALLLLSARPAKAGLGSLEPLFATFATKTLPFPYNIHSISAGGRTRLELSRFPQRSDQGNYALRQKQKEKIMDLLMTIGIVLLILWLLGLVTSYTLGGFIHILLVLAIIVILLRVIQGRR